MCVKAWIPAFATITNYKLMNKFTIKNFHDVLSALHIFEASNIYVAYSGGVDSHVLLHCLAKFREQYPHLKLAAIHVHHNLSANAAAWVKHCKNNCALLAIPFIIKYVDASIKIKGHSVEEVARNLRYQVFAETLSENACLLTAHHADDQAETLLLQLFRGAGPKGLAAMPTIIDFAKGKLVRPLLHYTRQDLLGYAKQEQLKWIEDESNVNTNYDRNYVRHNVLPVIQNRWPNVLQTLTRVARHCADADKLLTILAMQDLEQVRGGKSESDAARTLSINKLSCYSTPEQCNIIRYWLKSLGLSTPANVKMQQLLSEVLACRVDAMPVVTWSGVEVRRYQDELYAMRPLQPFDDKQIISWDISADSLILPGNLGILTAEIIGKLPMIAEKVTVRFRSGGEKCQLLGRKGGRQALKKLLQGWRVPPWQRNRIPLIYFGEKLVAVVGFCYCVGWPQEIKVRLDLAVRKS
jgi:tRNA(Ile)-lysidine synthase